LCGNVFALLEFLVHRRFDGLDDALALFQREWGLEDVAAIVADVPVQLAQVVALFLGFQRLDSFHFAELAHR